MAMDTYHGHVRTPADAIKLFEACRLGLLPRVQRRLSEKERQSIRSGSVFVWDEREAGMRRWTDGKSWSASRVSGSFLTYREMEGKRGGGNFVPPVRRISGKTPDSGRGSEDEDGEGPDGYRYKPDGLMKQSFSITTSTGQHLHLISYYSRQHPNSPDLPQPTTDPALRHIVPAKGMYPESTVHEAQGPAITRTPMQPTPYLQSPQHIPQGYARGPPPPYPYPTTPGYAWPPSPMSTPPFAQPQPYPQHVYGSSLPPPPGPGSAHNSPHQSAQHYSPHQMMPLPPAATPQSQGPPPATAYDRPPPPLSDSSLPPPPPHSRGMGSTTTPATLPIYAPNPSPRVEQARSLAEQQAQMAQRALQSPALIDPRLTTPGLPTLPPVHLSPRTNTPPQNSSYSQTVTPRTTTPTKFEPHTPKTSAPPSQAQTIPSISSLVHATDPAPVPIDNRSNSSRAGSRSPQEHGENSRPKDIPHEKMNNLAEDQRAIRVLDRKFVF